MENNKVLFQHAKEKTTLFAWIVCGLGALFYCYEYLLRIAPSVMSRDLMGAYNLDAAGFGHLVAYYYYIYTPMQIVVGIFMDRYGPRLLITLACLACAVGTYLFACSDILMIAKLGRFLVGFGSAFAFVGALKLATIWQPPERFALVSGLITGLGNLGAVVGDIFLTLLVQRQGWRDTNMSSAVFGIILAVIIVLIVRDSVSKATAAPREFKTTVAFSEVFVGLWAALKKPQIWKNGLMSGLFYIPTSAFAELWGIPYLEQARGLSEHEAAATVSMIFLGWVIGCPISGFISDRIKRRLAPLMFGALLGAIASAYIIYVPEISDGVLKLMFLFLGLSGSVHVLVFAVGRESSPSNIAGTAIALTNTFTMISGVIFQPIVGILLARQWGGQVVDGVHVYSASNFQYALFVVPVGMALAFLVLCFMKETHCQLLEHREETAVH